MSVPESTLPQFPLPESPLPESTSKKHKGADDSTDAFLDDHLSAFKRNLLKYAAAVGHEELRQAVLSDLNPEEPVEVEIDPQWEEDPAMNGPRK